MTFEWTSFSWIILVLTILLALPPVAILLGWRPEFLHGKDADEKNADERTPVEQIVEVPPAEDIDTKEMLRQILQGKTPALIGAPVSRDPPSPRFKGFRPLHDVVVVRVPDASETEPSGAISWTESADVPIEGVVVALGEGAVGASKFLDGEEIHEGDKVLFGKWSGTEVRIDGEDLILIKESDLLGLIG